MSTKVPFTIFSGFLGAGKTTLIADLLQQVDHRRFAVVVNEFGEVSIDGSTISAQCRRNTVIHNVIGGLIGYGSDECVSVFTEKIGQSVEHVIVETSGLAAPTALIEQLMVPPLSDNFLLDAVITVVDTPWLLESAPTPTSPTGDVFLNQLTAADIVVLNKVDSLSRDQLHQAEHLVRHKAPDIRFVELAHGARLDAELMLGVHLHEPRHKVASHVAATIDAAVGDGHSHSGLSAHEHGLLTHTHLHEHDPGWLSMMLHSHDKQDADRLKAAIDKISKTQQILRAKGFVTTVSDRQLALQCVRERIEIAEASRSTQGNHHHHDYHHEHHDHHEPLSELVFIGYHLDREVVATQLSQLTKTHWS